MTPAQNRALRTVLVSHLRHLDRFVMYIETAPGISLTNTIFEGIRVDTSYRRATVRAAIHQLEDQYAQSNPNPTRRGRPRFPATAGSGPVGDGQAPPQV